MSYNEDYKDLLSRNEKIPYDDTPISREPEPKREKTETFSASLSVPDKLELLNFLPEELAVIFISPFFSAFMET